MLWKWFRQTPNPPPEPEDPLGPATPPVNVRLRMHDGGIVPVECVYEGRRVDPDGDLVHAWKAPAPFGSLPEAFLADGIPDYTMITIGFVVDPRELDL